MCLSYAYDRMIITKKKGSKTMNKDKELTAIERARKKWNDNNREHRYYLNKRSVARSFIKNLATAEDLEELLHLIEERKNK